MASQDKKISSLARWLYENVEDAANMVVAHVGGNYRIALSTLKQYVLGNREIGGTGSMDITTNTDKQTLTQKRLDSPSFNDDVELNWNVTATQMNFLSGLDVNVNQVLNSIGSNIMTIENRIDDLHSTVDALQADKIYSNERGAGGAYITVLASEISADKIDPNSLSIFVYEQTSVSTMDLLNLSKIRISTSNNFLSTIEIAEVESGKSYQIVIRYRLLAE